MVYNLPDTINTWGGAILYNTRNYVVSGLIGALRTTDGQPKTPGSASQKLEQIPGVPIQTPPFVWIVT
jgi:hypothetical protein